MRGSVLYKWLIVQMGCCVDNTFSILENEWSLYQEKFLITHPLKIYSETSDEGHSEKGQTSTSRKYSCYTHYRKSPLKRTTSLPIKDKMAGLKVSLLRGSHIHMYLFNICISRMDGNFHLYVSVCWASLIHPLVGITSDKNVPL